MTIAGTYEVDDIVRFERRGSGVRASVETLHTYDLTVIAADVDGVVAAAGGWLCDRVRAGWQVTVLVPAGHDVTALTILGVRAAAVDSVADALRGHTPAAIAVDARVLSRDDRARRAVLRLVDGTRTEVTVWGESALFGSDARFGRVAHRLSAAAQAFKARAVATTGKVGPLHPAVEQFLSAALWYPPDGTDLAPAPEQ